MANMLYNGVELPDINEVWTDKEKYPYVAIYELDDGTYKLYLSPTPCRVRSPDLATYVGPKFKHYVLDNGGWTYKGLESSTYDCWGRNKSGLTWGNHDIYTTDGELVVAASDPIDPNAPTGLHLPPFYAGLAFSLAGPIIRGKSGSGKSVVLSNHDILNTDGSLYLAASTPIPCTPFPADFDPRSFAYGMRVGAVIRSLRGKAKEKEYTHYSYNGTVLPKLPESELPYAVIIKNSVGTYQLGFSNREPVFDGANIILADTEDATATTERYKYANDEWVFLDNGVALTWVGFASNIIWANVDVLNKSTGSVVESASDPVPVEVS